jgi:hypothetical protein
MQCITRDSTDADSFLPDDRALVIHVRHDAGTNSTPHTKDEIGQLLMDENVRSVWHRYDRDTFEEPPGPVDKTGIRDYRHIALDFPLDPIVLLKQLDCYAYQSFECPDWEESEAYDFCQVLRPLAEARLPPSLRRLEQSCWSSSRQLVKAFYNTDAYDEAPWGIDRSWLRGEAVA